MTSIPEKFRDRLAIDPAVSPDPVVKGTGISARWVVSLIADGWSKLSIARHFPLTEDDIRACIDYTAERDAMLPQNR